MANLLEKIYSSNPWFENEQLIEEDLHIRDLADSQHIFLNREFLEHKFADGVYIVTGPRQIGKTTHLKLLIQQKINIASKTDFLYFNCDLLETKEDVVDLVETYLKNFPSKKRSFIMLDEITAVKDSILGIKYLIDKGIKKTGEYLPGRRGNGVDFHFTPVSFRDFVKIQYDKINFDLGVKESLEKYYARIKNKVPLAKELNNYFFCGGIPKIINEYLAKKSIGLENLNLYRDWIVSEIAKNGKRENISKQILARILNSVTSDVSYNSFAQDSGIGSHNTVYEYLNFLEDAFIVSQIYNYDYDQKKINFRKNKKIYLNDPFLFSLLEWWLNGKIPSTKLMFEDSILKSRIAENLTFLHLKKIFSEVYFHRNNEEIDFICGKSAFESKFQNKIASDDFKGLSEFTGSKFIITKNTFDVRKEIKFLPLELFLLVEGKYFKIK